ncbi:MAG: hypothetical protein AAF587_25030 [Bacteroidota bacterium]
MKHYLYLLLPLILLFASLSSCKKDDILPEDDVYEFVFLTDTVFLMNELSNSMPGNEIELHAEMLAEPKDRDIVIQLELIAENAEEGTDYEIVSNSRSITIPAGTFQSEEGFKIRSVNNGLSSADERNLYIRISSVNDDSLNIGRGLSNPIKKEARINIVDDECSDDLTLFNNAEWSFSGSNTVYYSEYSGSFTTTINGNIMTITGDIANYDVGITVMATLTPDPVAPTTGTITFDPSTVGNDGTYDYRWVLNEIGTYDICAQTIQLSTTLEYIDIFGPDPTAWVDWYVSTIDAKIDVPGGPGASAPTGMVDANVSVIVGQDVRLTGSFADGQGLSEVLVQNADLGINQSIPLSAELTYDLNETYNISPSTLPGEYTVRIDVTNIESVISSFDVVVSVFEDTVCTAEYGVFDGETLTANADITATDGSFDPYLFTKEVSASISGDSILIEGDFIDFFSTQMKAQLVPDMNDPTIGTVVLTTQDLGEHTDGFTYRLTFPQGDGTYDACARKLNITYEMEYEDNGNWVFYYTTVTEFELKE